MLQKNRDFIALWVVFFLSLSACDNATEKRKQYLEEGKRFYKYGDAKKADAAFDKAVAVDPKNTQAHLAVAEEIANLGDMQATVGHYLEIIKQDPKQVEARIKLGQILLLASKLPEAQKLAQVALELDADNAEALVLMGGILSAQGNTDAAFVKAEQVLKTKPDNVPATLLLASLNAKIGKVDEAVNQLQRFNAKNPKEVSSRLLLTNLYSQTKQQEKAGELLQEIIRLEPKSLLPRQRLANLYLSEKQKDRAEEVLRTAVRDFPEDEQAKLMLVEFLLVAKSNEAAIAELLPTLEQKPDYVDLRFKLADLYAAQNKLKDVEETWQEIVSLAKQDAVAAKARNKLAQFYLAQNRLEDARAQITKTLTLWPDNSEAKILQAELALANGKTADAIADLRDIVTAEPENLKALKALSHAHQINKDLVLALENLQKILALNPNDEVARLEAVDLLLKSGNTKQAEDQLNTLFKLNPDSKNGLETLTKIYLAQKQWEQARQVAKELQTKFTDDATGYYLEGLSFQAEEKFDKSLEPLAKAVQRQPQAVEPLSQLTAAYLALKQPEKAVAKLKDIVKNHPGHFFAYNLLGTVYGNGNQLDEATAAYQKAIELRPNWSKSYRNLAVIKRLQLKPDEVVDTLTKGIANATEISDLTSDLVKVYHERGEYDKAIALYEQALQKRPESLSAMNDLVSYITAYAKDDSQLQKAEKLLQPLTQSNNASLLDTVGWFEFRQGRYEKAKDALLKAQELNKDYGVSQYHLGMVYYKLGDKALARQYLQKAVDSKTEFKGLTEAKEILKNLEKN